MDYWNKKDGRGNGDFVIETDATITVNWKTVRQRDVVGERFFDDCPVLLRRAVVTQDAALLYRCKARFYGEQPLLQFRGDFDQGPMPHLSPNERIVIDDAMRWHSWAERCAMGELWEAIYFGKERQEDANAEIERLAAIGLDAYRLSRLSHSHLFDPQVDPFTFADLRRDAVHRQHDSLAA